MNIAILIIILYIKKPIGADFSTLHEEIELNYKAPKSKAGDRIRITTYKMIL